MVAIITHDMKCGKYTIVCIVFLNIIFLTSFINKASIIGMGNPIKIFRKHKANVFFRILIKSGVLNNFVKFFNPHQLVNTKTK